MIGHCDCHSATELSDADKVEAGGACFGCFVIVVFFVGLLLLGDGRREVKLEIDSRPTADIAPERS